MLNDDRSFQIEVILLAEDIKQGWILASIDSNFVEFVPKIVLHWLLLECFSLKYHIILSLEHDAAQNIVLLFKQVGALQELDNFVTVDVVIALLDIHGHEI